MVSSNSVTETLVYIEPYNSMEYHLAAVNCTKKTKLYGFNQIMILQCKPFTGSRPVKHSKFCLIIHKSKINNAQITV
jgi:hypothetical protein